MGQSVSLPPGAPHRRDGEELSDVIRFNKTATRVAFMLISRAAAPSAPPLSSSGAACICSQFLNPKINSKRFQFIFYFFFQTFGSV